MSISIEKTGKTIHDAIQAALSELNAKEENAVIEVLEEGDSGGLLGIGKKNAKVRVSIEDDVAEMQDPVYYGDDESFEGDPETPEEATALDFVTKVLSGIGVRGNITSHRDEDTIFINVSGRDVGAIIGRRGETLDAMQYLTSLVVNRCSEQRYRIVLDIGGYRKRREETLVALAKRTAEKVVKAQKSYEMEPMSATERRIIHSTLQEYPGVTTFSEGESPDRCVIIAPSKE